MATPKTMFAWIREILGRHEKELMEMESPPTEEMVEKLIDKAVTGKLGKDRQEDNNENNENNENPDNNDNNENNDNNDNNENNDNKTCAYAVKRNIVESLQAIREFAAKHHLGETMLRALLTLLAELAVGALKGKVGEKTLDALLKALTFQQYAEESYLRGRNERVEMEYFPKADEIPHLGGLIRETNDDGSIFAMAREA